MAGFRKHYEPDSYIQDGLVFQLDGIDKGATSGAWTDRKGGIVFTNHGAVFQNDSVFFPAAQNAFLQNPASNVGPFQDGYTIEVCFMPGRQTSSSVLLLMQNKLTDSPCFGYYYGLLIHKCHNAISAYSFNAVYETKYTVSVSPSKAIANGDALSKSGNDYWGVRNGGMIVGARSDSGETPFQDGYIYSIRIYSRELTEAEMLENQQIDNIRFNLGLNI